MNYLALQHPPSSYHAMPLRLPVAPYDFTQEFFTVKYSPSVSTPGLTKLLPFFSTYIYFPK